MVDEPHAQDSLADMTRTLTAFASIFLLATTAHAGRPKCDDGELAAGLPRLAATNELQRPGLASVIVAQACSDDALGDAIQATLDDDTSLLMAYGTAQSRLWDRVCAGIEPNQVTSELSTTGCSVAHLGWSDPYFASAMTAAALSDDATAAPFQFSPALAAQQVGRALSAQTLARSRSDHQQAYLDAMAPVSTEERQQRAIRTATAGLAALSRRRQPGPLIGGLGSLAGTPDPSVDTPSADIPGLTGGTPIIMGDLPIAQVHTTLQALLPTLRACTTADGQITLKLVVQQDGTVGQALVSEGDLGPANTCIIETLQTAQFNMPADTGIVVLKYPLHFHAEP
ncbi:MAG: hypothetical protein ACJAZO_005021 [Myxococcota bacterium]